MKAVQVSKPGGNLEIVERPIPQPGRGQVRIKVEACGLCHSDVLVKEGHWPGIQYPRVPGHEIAGLVDAVGADVTLWKPGQRVGVGWHGGHCFQCDPCRRGDFMLCQFGKITGITFDGGYAEYMVAPAEAVALIPDDLPVAEAAPLLCAGITVYNSLRHAGALAGDLVAVQGIGGLGHLGIQYARQMGFRTVAIGRGKDKQALAQKLGAHEYVDTNAGAPAEALQKLGGARLILATAPDSKSISALVDGLAGNGKLLVVGAGVESLTVTPLQLIGGRKAIQGWPSGTAKDSEDTLRFSALSGVRPMIERYPLEKAAEAYDQMISGRARFRVVLTMS
ncbi:MAG: Alcohol dehydrogenase GroES protein [Candidatus Sulfotelmatobacter sp.]|nr:Alcohol dehydrogenase GroES protein [Candidatus Sulfotelmatobacter sp.]